MDCVMFYHVLLMIFAAISFCLMWTGYATPGWLAVTFQETAAAKEYTVSSLNRSLWYDILCPQELSNCKVCTSGENKDCVADMNYPNYTSHFTWIEVLTSDKEEWVLWRVFMTLAVVCCTVGFVFIACLVCCKLETKIYRGVAIVAFFIWLVPALLVWIPVAMVADMHEDIKGTVDNDIPHDSTLHAPYSVIIVAVGAFMALIVALMLIWLTGICSKSKKHKKGESTSTYSDSYSTDSRIKTKGYFYGPPQPYVYDNYYYKDQPTYVKPYTIHSTEEVVHPSRPTEEIVVPDYYVRSGRPTRNGIDDRSIMYSERWYDNRSNLL